MQHASKQMANRIAQAFPELSRGMTLEGFKVTFLPSSSEGREAIGRPVYTDNGHTLVAIELNSTMLTDQYKKMRDDVDVKFEDLVRMHVGIGVSTHLLFQRMLNTEKRSTNVADAMVTFLNDPDRIKAAFKETEGELKFNQVVSRTIDRLSAEQVTGPDQTVSVRGPERIVSINAQRMAFGMTMAAEEMYGSACGTTVINAMRNSIQARIITDTTSTALMGMVLQRDMDTALDVAADRLMAVQDFALAVPASKEELQEFLSRIQAADAQPETFSIGDILNLSEGFEI